MKNITLSQSNIDTSFWTKINDIKMLLTSISQVGTHNPGRLLLIPQITTRMTSLIIASALQNIPTSSIYYDPIFKVLSEYYFNIWDQHPKLNNVERIIHKVSNIATWDSAIDIMDNVRHASTWIVLDKRNHQDEIINIHKLHFICRATFNRLVLDYNVLWGLVQKWLLWDSDFLIKGDNLEQLFKDLETSTKERIECWLNSLDSYPYWNYTMIFIRVLFHKIEQNFK